MTTQGFLNNISQGVCMEKIYIESILVNLIQSWQHTTIQSFQHILITTFHFIFIQSFHHTKFVCVHISLLLLHIQYPLIPPLCYLQKSSSRLSSSMLPSHTHSQKIEYIGKKRNRISNGKKNKIIFSISIWEGVNHKSVSLSFDTTQRTEIFFCQKNHCWFHCNFQFWTLLSGLKWWQRSKLKT